MLLAEDSAATIGNGRRPVLVRGVNWIGDAVMTIPALRSLKLADRSAALSLLVKPWVAPLFERSPAVDETILYESRHTGVAGKFRLAALLRKRGFSSSYLFQNAFDAAAVTFLAGIPERIGYSRDGRRLLLTKAVPFDAEAGRLHHIRYYLNLIEKAGIAAEYSMPWIPIGLDERARARERLRGLRRPLIGINPGATFGSSKRWQPGRFAEVARRVLNEAGGGIVLFGGASETGITDEVVRELSAGGSPYDKSAVLVLAGRTTLRELASLIAECDVLLTNDSGPMHIGYAVGTPVVAIFGSTSPEHTGPAGKRDVVIRKEIGCAPCFDRTCRKGQPACMELIAPDEVFGAVRELLPRRRAIFFDRDGTICRDAGYLNRMEDLSVFPGTKDLVRLKDEGFLLIGITNQSGIARGLVGDAFVREVNGLFEREYGFDRFYVCPHHPNDICSCRKPEPGLLVEARADYGISLRQSYVVGDRESDMMLAKAAGATGILVRTGLDRESSFADFTVHDVTEAARIIGTRG